MIEIRNLSKSYGKKKVLDKLNCNIKTGSIYGLIGANGAGKSTLLRIINDIFKRDEGTILIDDVEVEEVESDKTGERKYKIELSKEDMKRLFYRKTNDEYISMIIADSGIVYLYVNVNTRYLTRVEIDLTNIIDMQDPDSTCNQLKLEFEYSEYNNLDPIEIPDYVTKTAQ